MSAKNWALELNKYIRQGEADKRIQSYYEERQDTLTNLYR